MTPKKDRPDGTQHTTAQEINFIKECLEKRSVKDRPTFLAKYIEGNKKRKRWSCDSGSNLDKKKIMAYCRMRLRALTKGG